jgi:tetratricopeptide (TPR) repeat protein
MKKEDTKKHFVLVFWVALLVSVAVLIIFFAGKRAHLENPGREIENAWFQFRMGEYKQAEKIFDRVIESVPLDSELRFKAMYGLGCTLWLKLPSSDEASAKKIFKEIIRIAPESEYTPWSMLALTRLLHIVSSDQTPDYPRLRKDYEALYKKFPNHIAAHEAFVYMIGTYIAACTNKDAEIAKTKLNEFIENHPDSFFISSAWGLYAKACETLGLKEEMLSAKIMSLEKLESDPTNPKMEKSNAYWEIAVIAEFECGDFDTARKYYGMLIQDYHRDRRNFPAMQAIERMNSIEEKILNQ